MDRAVNLILFSFGKITTKVFTRSVRVLYVVCSPTKVVLNLIELLIDSLTVSPFFAAKTFYEELDINNVCVQLNIKNLYFSIGKSTTLTAVLMHSFSV